MARLACVAAATLSFLCAACDDTPEYPFIGKWELPNANAPNLGFCARVPKLSISAKHILFPLSVLTITEVRNENGRWILHTSKDGKPVEPPVVIIRADARALAFSAANGMMTCDMQKVGKCTNALCD